MIKYALRLFFVINKFGTDNIRTKNISYAVMEKYDQRNDKKSFLRILTLAEALLEANSFHDNDENIIKHLNNFLLSEKIKDIYEIESKNYFKYSSALMINFISNDNKNDNKSKQIIADYEALNDTENK